MTVIGPSNETDYGNGSLTTNLKDPAVEKEFASVSSISVMSNCPNITVQNEFDSTT